MKIATSAQMREIDHATIGEMRIPGLRLMENAGKAVADKIIEYFPNARSIGFFCGKGNNGGDGLVCARHLIQQSLSAEVFLLSKSDELKGDAKANLSAYLNLSPKPILVEISNEEQLKQTVSILHNYDVLVDALLGTGTSGQIHGLTSLAIDVVNHTNKPIVSIDIPTGLDADRGTTLGKCIKPVLTVTLGLPKIGLVTYPGAKHVGRLKIADIGIPEKVIRDKHLFLNWMTDKEMALLLPHRDPDSHKGTYGHVMVLAGSPGFTGAAALTSLSALRSGAGLVTLGIPSSLQSLMATKLTEVMTLGLPETPKHFFDINAEPIILDFLYKAKVLAIGPGISTNEQTMALVRRLIQVSPRPMVIDADGLYAFSQDPSVCKLAKVPLILTPHPGEMARLTHSTIREVQGNRIGVAQKFSKEYNVYLVLKGSRTIIAEPGGQIYINSTGNAGMASGGSGDVLTGLITGFLAQGLNPLESCILGTYLHGSAGDIAADELTQFAMIAGDLITYLPKAIQQLQKLKE